VTASDSLDLDDTRRSELARGLEDAAATLGAVRYGSRLRVGPASVVLNPDSPLASGALATGLDAGPVAVEGALRALPAVFGEAGLGRVVLSASPSSAPELELLAEEVGYEAVEETTTMLLTRPALLVEGEPGRSVIPLPEREEHHAAPLVADAHGWSAAVERRLHRLLGHRFDDPRHVTVMASEGGEPVGLATGFLHGGLGQVVDVSVRRGRRGRGTGSALASAVAAVLLGRGAELVWLQVEAGGTVERGCAALGFEPAYDAVTYVLPVE
jgi:ribosomal protein S18 acetylase RimI-like enzyme